MEFKGIIILSAITAIMALGVFGGKFLFAEKPAGKISESEFSATVISASEKTAQIPADEIEKHNTAGDCYVIIDEMVYDMTRLIKSHPGGSQAIISNCGKDGTRAFEARGGQGPHSANAASELAGYLKGPLAE